MLVELKALQRPSLHCDKDLAREIETELSELHSKMELRRTRRDLLKEYGAILHERRKIRGVTLIELSKKAGVSRENIELAERGVFQLSDKEKQRIKKFLRRQPII